MTAVEFLEKELYERFHLSYLVLFNELINQAKEMEKEQIMDAIKFTIQDEFAKQTWKNGKCSHDAALNYYKQTFKSE